MQIHFSYWNDWNSSAPPHGVLNGKLRISARVSQRGKEDTLYIARELSSPAWVEYPSGASPGLLTRFRLNRAWRTFKDRTELLGAFTAHREAQARAVTEQLKKTHSTSQKDAAQIPIWSTTAASSSWQYTE